MLATIARFDNMSPMAATGLGWLGWVRTLQSVGQAGLTYSEDPFDRDRYHEVGMVAAEMAAAVSGLPTAAVAEAFAADAGHPTPKVDVRGAVFRDGRVLLVRERVDGGWTLPGGWATLENRRAPRSLARCAKRVVTRSSRSAWSPFTTAIDTTTLRSPTRSTSCSSFARLLEDKPASAPDHEVDTVDWFDPYQPPLLSTGRVTAEQLELVARYEIDPDRLPEFD